MNRQLYILIYAILLGYSASTENNIFIISVIALGILILAFVPVYKKYRKNKIKNHIESGKEGSVLNVNRAYWWEIEELPGFSRVSAKKAVWIRKHNGKYLSKKDFCEKNGINNPKGIIKYISL